MNEEIDDAADEMDRTSHGDLVALATPVDRLLAWLVDTLIYVGVGVAGGIVGVLLALLVIDDASDLGETVAVIVLIVVLAILPILVWTVIVLFMVARTGQSPGKRLLKTRIVNADGSAWGWSGTLIREVLGKFLIGGLISGVLGAVLGSALGDETSSIVGLLVGLLLFIWILIDEKNQTLHDKLASTYVVKVE